MADFFQYSFRMTIFECNKFIHKHRLKDIDGLRFFYLATLIVVNTINDVFPGIAHAVKLQ